MDTFTYITFNVWINMRQTSKQMAIIVAKEMCIVFYLFCMSSLRMHIVAYM